MPNNTPVRLSEICSIEQLAEHIEQGYIAVRTHPNGKTHLLNYTARAQYGRVWTHETKLCRGLIVSAHPLDEDAVVIARPFAKFANAHEHGPDSPFGELPVDQPFEVFEKLDGSLAIAYELDGAVSFATRGSFVSEQAQAATALWQRRFGDVVLPQGVTLLFEYVAPWNRIVVGYDEEDLVLLGGIEIASGADADLSGFAWPGRSARRFDGMAELSELASHMRSQDTADAEGFVLRFVGDDPAKPSLRAKVKYDEYLRLHRLVTGVSNVSIWEQLSNQLPLDELFERVPDEFHAFVTATVAELQEAHDDYVHKARALAATLAGLPRKDAAAVILGQTEVPSGLVFAALDDKDVDLAAWRLVRPEHKVPEWAARADS